MTEKIRTSLVREARLLKPLQPHEEEAPESAAVALADEERAEGYYRDSSCQQRRWRVVPYNGCAPVIIAKTMAHVHGHHICHISLILQQAS